MWILSLVTARAEPPDPVLEALSRELEVSVEGWREEPDPPYYLAYRSVDRHVWRIEARYGALASSSDSRVRVLDVVARVGSFELDSTHPIRDASALQAPYHMGQQMPVSGPPEALQSVVWEATNKEVRDAQELWRQLQTVQKVKVEEIHEAPDFSPATAVVDVRPLAELEVDRGAWEDTLIEVSAVLDAHPDILRSAAELSAEAENHYIVTSEGTRLRHPRTWLRVDIHTEAIADDGMVLRIYRWKDVRVAEALPDADELTSWAEDLVQRTVALRVAPLGDAYDGPILLRGPAAGVFMHEVIGHRVEGHRQKDEKEGQTFREKIGTQLLPPDISIFDDPTLDTWTGTYLNGSYAYDDEGQPAQRAWIVRDGVFEGFLMSRSPIDIEGFHHSNGHGRASSYNTPTARMANTIVSSSRPVPVAELRAMLLAEVRAQGREYGMMIEELAGGFTMTGRVYPNSFNVRATYGWRVYADGRPDELVRGIDLVGTPLVALSNVMAAGDDPGVFNGFCGASSGSVPNAAVSPSLLIRQLETQKKESSSDRPPLLPKPQGPETGT
ncbi:MAG: TldD/PmbA family protein [Myxococcota bacterium]